MLTTRQRTAVWFLAALSLLTLLHVHSGLDGGSLHCNACVQQSHALVADLITVSEDPRVEFPEALEITSFSWQTVARPADPRGPPA